MSVYSVTGHVIDLLPAGGNITRGVELSLVESCSWHKSQLSHAYSETVIIITHVRMYTLVMADLHAE